LARREVAQVGAVIGRGFSYGLLRAVASLVVVGCLPPVIALEKKPLSKMLPGEPRT
jgi:hypothetical protein